MGIEEKRRCAHLGLFGTLNMRRSVTYAQKRTKRTKVHAVLLSKLNLDFNFFQLQV